MPRKSCVLLRLLRLLSACCEQSRQECGARGHGVDEDVLVVRMGAIANGAKTVQGGNAESACEVSIRAAARCAFAQRKMHLLCE